MSFLTPNFLCRIITSIYPLEIITLVYWNPRTTKPISQRGGGGALVAIREGEEEGEEETGKGGRVHLEKKEREKMG